jgi:esterase/lipase superfamily enzyme
VATNRGPDPDHAVPGALRSANVEFGRFTVSVPAQRDPGEITRPAGRIAANPSEHFMLADAQTMSRDAFRAAIRTRIQALPANEHEAVMFVHGYNTAFIEGVYRAAQLDHDLQLPGVMMHYSWPSLATPLAYAHDRDSVLFARDGLVEALREIRAAGTRRIILVAHSMGSQLVMESLRQMALAGDPALSAVGGVILISPDIDVAVFRQQARAIGDLPQPFLIMTSRRDRVLQLSARLSGESARLGNLSDPEAVAELDVTLVDVSAFSEGSGHFTVGSSPALIQLLGQIGAVNTALANDRAGELRLLPATILTLQNTTQIILQPIID